MEYKSETSIRFKFVRLFWDITWTIFARPLPRQMGRRWKNFLLRLFGADIHPTASVYSKASIKFPPNLTMEANTVIGPDTDISNLAMVTLKEGAVISQKSYLCTQSHDINTPAHTLICAPITIGKNAWVAADAYIGMGVTIGEGAVVGARASVYRDVEPWTVVGGNPAKKISVRDKEKFL